MADIDYVFIHPLIEKGDNWSGFLVETASNCPAEQAEQSLQHFLNNPKLAEFDQRQPWFFNAPFGSALNLPLPAQMIATFPAQQPPGTDLETVRDLEARLRQHSKVALRTTSNQKLPTAGTWDYLLISTTHARSLPPFTLLGLSSRTTIVITEVNSHSDFEWANNNSCTLATSEFLLSRHAHGKKADMTRLKLLEMLALLAADADTAAIEEIFRQEPKLAYSLLRLVNSAANAPRSPISSFSQAINMLGRRQLQRWLQLLVYADQNNGQQTNPLLQKAARRGRMMEFLAKLHRPTEACENFFDAVFMVGTFSLLDVLLNMPIKEVLEHLPLTPDVSAALAEHKGPLGQLLDAIVATESRDLNAARQQLSALGIQPSEHLHAQLESLHWANKVVQQN